MNNIYKSIIATSLVAALSGCWTTSTGQKTGVIVKLAKEGIFIGTWEAELIRGGFSNGDGVNGQSFHFTVQNKNLVEKLKQYFENQKEVLISYHHEFITAPGRGETKNFLDDVKLIKKN